MRVGLNLLYAHPGIGGAWNYIASAVDALGRYGPEHEYFAYVHDSSRSIVPELPNFHIRPVRVNGERRVARVMAEHFIVPRLAGQDRLDLLHWFGNVRGIFPSRIPCFVSVHDVKSFDLGGHHGLTMRDLYMRLLLPYTARTARKLLPVSQTTATGMNKWFDVAAERMEVIPPSINDRFRQSSAEEVAALRSDWNLPADFWLYVSHYYPHKNHRRLFQAYAQLRRQAPASWKLVLCGRKNGADEILNQWIREAGIEDHVIWLSGLAAHEIPVLFTAATALVFPSEYEGGGIPVMEAMACGCPVLASRIPAIEESTGGTAILFDPLNVDAISGCMLRVSTEPGLLEQLKTGGRERIEAQQRPARVASRLLRAYRSILASE